MRVGQQVRSRSGNIVAIRVANQGRSCLGEVDARLMRCKRQSKAEPLGEVDAMRAAKQVRSHSGEVLAMSAAKQGKSRSDEADAIRAGKQGRGYSGEVNVM
ncbi:hypothetical protein NDU88_006984 [Pleurodeles waltl]|uniref:Uncharacterized protein n=1 Tax=Pleurodeles waltl TaxID=8319 RepID=A0AAV7PJY9_PLEWA|nr:hypothetical protein NDU88_006984 [Pleurodeles waltl]